MLKATKSANKKNKQANLAILLNGLSSRLHQVDNGLINDQSSDAFEEPLTAMDSIVNTLKSFHPAHRYYFYACSNEAIAVV